MSELVQACQKNISYTFLDGWHQMSINGYTDEELVDGPQNGWMGYYSLSQQGVDVGDFETYIDANAPVTFTDINVSAGSSLAWV